MKRILLFLLFLGSQALGQSLQSLNYNYVYDPELSHTFRIDILQQQKDSLIVAYQLSVKDTLQPTSDFTITWETFESLSDKKGINFYPTAILYNTATHVYGTFHLQTPTRIIAAKVISKSLNTAWYYYKVIDPNTSLDGYVLLEDKVIDRYVSLPSSLEIHNGKDSSTVFYYSDKFPAAATPFAETQGNIARTWKPDSVLSTATTLLPFATGLYLIQADTSSAKGICFRAEDNYPKYSTLQNLVGPLTYITTKNEYERLRNSQNDKKAFDRIILGITGNAERARLFMRNYFRRVELANRYFTSYKEGWKTDRGMIYIIFGKASFVYKFEDREVWEYSTATGEKFSFTFVKSASLFDPENYVLVRKRSYQDIWLEAVDLNRNARF